MVQELHLQYAEQNDDGTNERIQEKHYCRIESILATPNSNQEVHRDESHFKKEVEQKQIHRSEHAKNESLQQQQQNVVFLLALGDVLPRRHRRQHPEERRQHNQKK